MEKRMGRPPKPEQRYVFRTIRFPPDLWADLEAVAPPRGRSSIVQEGLRRELVRLKRRLKQADE
jgi:hypothetical protein